MRGSQKVSYPIRKFFASCSNEACVGSLKTGRVSHIFFAAVSMSDRETLSVPHKACRQATLSRINWFTSDWGGDCFSLLHFLTESGIGKLKSLYTCMSFPASWPSLRINLKGGCWLSSVNDSLSLMTDRVLGSESDCESECESASAVDLLWSKLLF